MKLNHKPLGYIGDALNLPYTPISKMIEMINKAGPIIKSEPVSHLVQLEQISECANWDGKKTWKRHERKTDRKKGKVVEVGTKRKEDFIKEDRECLGETKKTKNTIDDTLSKPAKTTDQPRRAL